MGARNATHRKFDLRLYRSNGIHTRIDTYESQRIDRAILALVPRQAVQQKPNNEPMQRGGITNEAEGQQELAIVGSGSTIVPEQVVQKE